MFSVAMPVAFEISCIASANCSALLINAPKAIPATALCNPENLSETFFTLLSNVFNFALALSVKPTV